MSTKARQRWPLTGRSEALETFTDALADRAALGLVLAGPAGVGKSRLADECLAVAEDRGHPTARVTASRTAASIPLAALAHLLPADAADPTGSGRRRSSAALDERFGTGRVVLRIDDAHLLDATSAVLVEQLVLGGRILLVATARTGEPVAEPLAALWTAPTGSPRSSSAR